MSKLKKPQKNNEEKPIPEHPGLDQSFTLKDGSYITLKNFLVEGDWWELKRPKSITYIVKHDAVKRIADAAGISKDVEYKVLTQPEIGNNYTYLIQARIQDHRNKVTVDLGESNRANLNQRGRNNPANMAQKRAFDRAVFNHLNINGVLGEDELQEDEEQSEMDKLTLDEQKHIAPLINNIFAIKKREDLDVFIAKMKEVKVEYTELEVNYLRLLCKKKLAELSTTF